MSTHRDEAGGAPLSWRRTNPFRDWFELRAGNQRLVTLTIKGRTAATAQVDTGHSRFLFTSEGIDSQRVRIFDTTGESTTVGTFDRRRSGQAGTLRLVEGGRLAWRRVGWWRPTYVFTNRFGEEVVRLRPNGGVIDCDLGVRLDPSVDTWHDLLLLLAFGWFLVVIGGNAAPTTYGSAATEGEGEHSW
jgi:hypothetical protein